MSESSKGLLFCKITDTWCDMDYFPLLPEIMLIATGLVFFAATLAKPGQVLLERAAFVLALYRIGIPTASNF